jgi:DNA polymerase II small subunit
MEKGYQVTPDAFDLIKKEIDPLQTINDIIEKISKDIRTPVVLDKNIINSLINKKKETEINETVCLSELNQIEPAILKTRAKKNNLDFKIIFDPTGKSYSTGKTEDFVKYFQDRYERIKKIFLLRNDMQGLKNISDIDTKKTIGESAKIIAMVMDKRETKNGNLLFELEDLTGNILSLINSKNKEVFIKANKIVKDQVLCFEGKTSSSNFFFIDDFYWPNTSTQHKPPYTDENISVALISDIHIGSKEFMEKNFIQFVDWLRGKVGTEKQKELAYNIQYIVIAGDLVDGIGIYPNQEKDLIIKDIYEQYEKAEELLALIPEGIQIIISPGNHDATRQAMPQPAISEKYAGDIYKLSNVTMIGNPSQISINNINFLIYHGRSLDDIAASVPGASIQESANLMKELLISRHLAPQFGNRTPISPELKDWLVIENEPDVFHSGHVHVNGIESHRNILLVNSGTWQSQTSYQKSMGLIPTPCKVPIYNLNTNKVMVIDFLEKCS